MKEICVSITPKYDGFQLKDEFYSYEELLEKRKKEKAVQEREMNKQRNAMARKRSDL